MQVAERDVASGDRAFASSKCIYTAFTDRRRRGWSSRAPATYEEVSAERRSQSLSTSPRDQCVSSVEETYLYLAYGSNLSDETFLGNRGIKPLSAINVLVPDLRLTFDLPGIPYAEPCFANTARREVKQQDHQTQHITTLSEKTPLLIKQHTKPQGYQKDKWTKGLVGVVYEVTPNDYAHIIATEGGGSSYHDIEIDCYPFASSDPTQPVPAQPETESFRAHTLFAPATPAGEQPPKDGGRFQRPDTSYAQASARYLKLLTDGAEERRLPFEYQEWLQSLHPYIPTTQKQRLGQFVFLSLWMPLIMFVFSLQRAFNDDKGRAPDWLRILAGAIFQAAWGSYDGYFKDLFGEGERTVKGDDNEEADPEKSLRQPVPTVPAPQERNQEYTT